MNSIKKRILALSLSAAMLISLLPFSAFAADGEENTVVDNGVAGYLMDVPQEETFLTYNDKYVNYGTRLFMKKSQDPLSHTATYGQGSGSGIYVKESNGEYFTILNPQESYDADNRLKESNGGIYYNTVSGRGLTEDGGAIAGMPSNVDPATLEALAIRFKVTGGEADKYSSVSISHNNSGFISLSNAYFIDSVSGAVVDPNFSSHRLAITGEFDGWLVIPYATLSDAQKTHLESTGKALYFYFHTELCSTSSHGPDTKGNWKEKILWVGDIALVDDETKFKKAYGGPAFDLASGNHSITVISDETEAVYSLDKNADASKWLTKEEFNKANTNLPKGTAFTVYAKYATSEKIISKEISTTADGIAGYLMDVPEEETFLTYNSKYVNYGTRLFMKKDQDPFSQTATYGQGNGSGIYIRESNGEYFAILNPQESYNTNGTVKESNGGIYHNTVSGRGLTEEGGAIKGIPEGVDPKNIEALAIRFKVTGGEAEQYSSVSISYNNSGFIDLGCAYFIDNTTGLVVNPFYTSEGYAHRLGITGEFDGWLVIPYEYITSVARECIEETYGALYFYFHTDGCTTANHGKDTKSSWLNRIFWLGDMALVENEEDFVKTYSKPLETTDGVSFSHNELDYVDGAFSNMINTFEATIKMPKNFPTPIRGGVIFGSYGFQKRGLNFEVHTNGNLRVFWSQKTSTGTDTWEKLFDGVNVLNGEKTHIAIVNNKEADTISCYINGQLIQTLEGAVPEWISTRAGVLGGDFRDGNPLSFRGELFSVALYSDVRTQEEINADMTAVSDDNLMAYWDLTRGAVQGKYPDESGNGHDVTLGKIWFTDKEPVMDYDYSFALVGDTQVVNVDYSDRLSDAYDWIVANKEEKKIEYVLGLGDITDKDLDREWTNADEQVSKLDGVVPYSLVRGNHDGTAKFNATFDKAPYNTTFAGRYDDKLENTYRELVVGDIKYLIFTLDIGAADEVLAWAGNIIEAHPEHNVIITTHIYLDNDGTHIDANSQVRATKYGGTNNGDDIWKKFVSQYENIVMVFCGHVSQGRAILTQAEGVNGNIVSQMLVDPQGVDVTLGATGMVTMLYFSEDGSKVSVETYSTVRDKYYITHGQYDFTVPVIKHEHSYEAVVTAPTCTDKGFTTYTCPACGDSYVGDEVEALGHAYVDTVVPPTTTSQGYTDHTCSVCGDNYKDNYTDPVQPEEPEVPEVPTNRVNNVVVTPSDIDVTVTWDSFEGADRYLVRALNPDGTTFNTQTITDGSNTAVFKGLEYNTEYTFFVIARVGGKYQSVDDADKIASGLVIGDRVVGIKSSVKGRTITVSWMEYPGADRYYVMVYPKGADPTVNANRVTTVNAGNATTVGIINVIAPEVDYDIYVSARVGGKYMTLENALKTSAIIPVTAPNSFEITSIEPTVFRIKWNAVKNADRYWARIVDEDGNIVKNRECAKALVSFTGLTPGKTYYVQLQARVPKSSGGYQYSGFCDLIMTQPVTLPLA